MRIGSECSKANLFIANDKTLILENSTNRKLISDNLIHQ